MNSTGERTGAGAASRRTHHTASARKVSEIGMTMTCACRSANRKLHSGNSLIVS